MMEKKIASNYGIQISQGNLQANNVAVGDNALAHSGNISQVLGAILELKDILSNAQLSTNDRTTADEAVSDIETESKKSLPEKGKVQSALERLSQLGVTSTALFPLIDRMTPLLQRIGQSLLG